MSTLKLCRNCRNNNKVHVFQDREYGEYIRLFNVSEKDGNKTSTCTVCGATTKTKSIIK